jgi:hypothetical protein
MIHIKTPYDIDIICMIALFSSFYKQKRLSERDKRNLALINARFRNVFNFVSAQQLLDLEIQKVLSLV